MATKVEDIDGNAKATSNSVETIVQETRGEDTAKDANEATPPKAVDPQSFENAPDPDEDDLDDLDGTHFASPRNIHFLKLTF